MTSNPTSRGISSLTSIEKLVCVSAILGSFSVGVAEATWFFGAVVLFSRRPGQGDEEGCGEEAGCGDEGFAFSEFSDKGFAFSKFSDIVEIIDHDVKEETDIA